MARCELRIELNEETEKLSQDTFPICVVKLYSDKFSADTCLLPDKSSANCPIAQNARGEIDSVNMLKKLEKLYKPE